jgi:hypothetical protein
MTDPAHSPHADSDRKKHGDAPPHDANRPLALVSDLIFASRISATARSLGIDAKILRRPDQLESENGKLLLLDLNLHGAIEAAVQWKRRTSGLTVGFVAHVDAATIDRARDAGIDRILARSAFVAQLPQLLTGAETENLP